MSAQAMTPKQMLDEVAAMEAQPKTLGKWKPYEPVILAMLEKGFTKKKISDYLTEKGMPVSRSNIYQLTNRIAGRKKT